MNIHHKQINLYLDFRYLKEVNYYTLLPINLHLVWIIVMEIA